MVRGTGGEEGCAWVEFERGGVGSGVGLDEEGAVGGAVRGGGKARGWGEGGGEDEVPAGGERAEEAGAEEAGEWS